MNFQQEVVSKRLAAGLLRDELKRKSAVPFLWDSPGCGSENMVVNPKSCGPFTTSITSIWDCLMGNYSLS